MNPTWKLKQHWEMLAIAMYWQRDPQQGCRCNLDVCSMAHKRAMCRPTAAAPSVASCIFYASISIGILWTFYSWEFVCVRLAHTPRTCSTYLQHVEDRYSLRIRKIRVSSWRTVLIWEIFVSRITNINNIYFGPFCGNREIGCSHERLLQRETRQLYKLLVIVDWKRSSVLVVQYGSQPRPNSRSIVAILSTKQKTEVDWTNTS